MRSDREDEEGEDEEGGRRGSQRRTVSLDAAQVASGPHDAPFRPDRIRTGGRRSEDKNILLHEY